MLPMSPALWFSLAASPKCLHKDWVGQRSKSCDEQ